MAASAVPDAESGVPTAAALAFANVAVTVDQHFAALVFHFARDDRTATRGLLACLDFHLVGYDKLLSCREFRMRRAEFAV